jgi:hypothetical protein
MCGDNGWVIERKPNGKAAELIPCYYPECHAQAPLEVLSVYLGDFHEVAVYPNGSLIMSLSAGRR